jgi:hypothetical protein
MSSILKGIQLNEVNPNNYDSDWDYQDAVARSGRSRSRSSDSYDAHDAENDAYEMHKRFAATRARKEAAAKAAAEKAKTEKLDELNPKTNEATFKKSPYGRTAASQQRAKDLLNPPKPQEPKKDEKIAEEGYGNHPSQRVDPRTGKKYVPPKSPLNKGVAETTGDKPFDNMMKNISKGTNKQKTADRKEQQKQTQQQARDAFGNMFGGGNPADKLKIREQGVVEGWSQKYKSSINCSHPKGFSQKAHCAGKKKHNESIEMEMTCEDCGMCQTHGDNSKDKLDELKCWSGYHRVAGTKAGFPGSCAKNKTNEEDLAEQSNYDWSAEKEKIRSMSTTQRREYALARLEQTNDDKFAHIASKAGAGHSEIMNAINKGRQGVAEEQHSCPHCGGEMVSEELMNEKKDACYYKVKSRYKVWPSAYASGALVKCRNKGASNWGNSSKNESSILEGINRADESLHDWFNKEKWVRMDTKGNIKGPCAKEPGEGKPKCLPQSKAHSLGKKGRASAAARKRREDPNPDRSGKAINVDTKKKD